MIQHTTAAILAQKPDMHSLTETKKVLFPQVEVFCVP